MLSYKAETLRKVVEGKRAATRHRVSLMSIQVGLANRKNPCVLVD